MDGWAESASSVMTAGIGHGHHADPVCVVPVRRHHQRGAAQAMRDGSLWPWRDAIRNHPPGRCCLPLCRALSALYPAGRVARHWGNDDRGSWGQGRRLRLSLSPFEAMTTVTAKIVSQLTGDGDFGSAPKRMVAFALGTDAVRDHPVA